MKNQKINSNNNAAKRDDCPSGWTIISIKDIFQESCVKLSQIDNFQENIPILSMTRYDGLVLQAEKFGKRVASKNLSNYKVVNKGEFVVGFPIDEGVIFSLKKFPCGVVSPVYTIWKKINDSADSDFLDYYLKTPEMIEKYKQVMVHAVERRRYIKKEDFLILTIPLPPLPEQRAIARVLRTVQEAKEKTDAGIVATKALKAAMMKHLFTYGPVPPEEADMVVLKETEIGPVPEGWDIKPLKEISTIYSGGTPSKDIPEFWNGEIPWASPKDLKSLILSDVIDHISEEGLAAGSRLVPENSIFIVIRGMILIRDVPVSLITRPMAFNQDMKAICPSPYINPMYLLYAISHYRMNLSCHIGTSAHGTKRISTSAIEDFLVPVPSDKEQITIVDTLDLIERKLAAEQSRREALDTLFNTLLHDLMTTKIRVKETIS